MLKIAIKAILSITLTIISSSATTAQSQKIVKIKDFKTYDLPTSKDSLIKYNRQETWHLVAHKGKLAAYYGSSKKAELPFYFKQPEIPWVPNVKPYILKVKDGYLAAYDGGEFGASLLWISPEGKQSYKISGEHVREFFKLNGELYAIHGLSHGWSSSGAIVRVYRENGRWISTTYLDLPSAPMAVAVYGNQLLLITSEQLLLIDKDKHIKTLIENGFWKIYLAISDIVIKRNVAYIGMRGGVFKYNLKTHDQSWLMP